MPLKTKILGLFLLILIVLPVVLSPVSRGNVLGVTDRLNSSSIKPIRGGEIAGGVTETKNEGTTNKTKKGLAVLDLKTKNSVTSNKFPLASEIKIAYESKELDLVVTSVAEIPTEALVSLNKETFISLGGNPETQTEIEVNVTN